MPDPALSRHVAACNNIASPAGLIPFRAGAQQGPQQVEPGFLAEGGKGLGGVVRIHIARIIEWFGWGVML